MRRYIFSTLFLICLLSSGATAQYTQVVSKEKHHLNTVSLTVYGLAPIAVYERIIPIGVKFGVIGSIGGFYYGDTYLGYSLGATFYAGSTKHKGELGAVYLNEVLTIGYGAYRYTSSSGLFVKGGLGYVFMQEGGVVPILALGYAF
jgi:hypothetical protein